MNVREREHYARQAAAALRAQVPQDGFNVAFPTARSANAPQKIVSWPASASR
jgi:hypothetical protein